MSAALLPVCAQARTQGAPADIVLQAKQVVSPREISASSSQINSSLGTADTLAAQVATSYQKVTQVYTTPERIRTLVHITLDNGQTLTATDGHPFKTLDGWRDAVLLKKGGKLLLGGGEEDPAAPLAQPRYARIADVRIEQERITTYNLEVAQLHTFLVGGDGVVVHNGFGSYTCTFKSGKKYHGKGDRKRAQKSADDHAREYGDPVVDIDWTTAANDRESFKDEYNRMQRDGGHKSPTNYNKRNSPGRRY
ncbi:MAG: Hint domain-containing protein [Rhodoferax sp.]